MINEREEDLRDPALSQLYCNHAGMEPSPALDQFILAQAHRAACLPAGRKEHWWRRFSAPLALAATVVLAVMLSLTVDRQPPEFIPPPVPVEQPPAPVETRQATPAASIPSAPRSKAETPPPHLASSGKTAAPVSGAPGKTTGPLPFPGTAAPRPEVPSAPVSPAASERASLPAFSRSREATPEAATPRLEKSPALPPPATDDLSRNPPPRPPEIWVEDIRALIRQGKMTDAEQSLAEFRRTYPNYRLPDDLR